VNTRALSRARDEAGSTVVVALVVMGLLLSLSLSLLAQVDSEQAEGGRQRARESSFQVAEGALNAQVYQLSTRWPDSMAPYPTACDQGTMSQQDCPSANAMVETFRNVDQAKSSAWTTQVRDNDESQPNYWSDSLLDGYTFDENGDGYVWVRSSALVNERQRSLVALIKAEQTMIPPPGGSHALVAGYFTTTNNGNKVIIDSDGADDEFTNGDVVVRCQFADANPPEPGCAQYEDDNKKGSQVSPERVFSNPTQPNLTPEQLAALRAAAKAAGNYYDATYAGCPPLQGDQPGETVFIEQLPGSGCMYNGNTDYNTATKPGVVVIGKGKLFILGTASFHGLLYHANLDNSNEVLIDLGGNVSVVGAISVDGAGGVFAGSSKVNIVFDGNVFNNFEGLNTYGTASIVPNTFREIAATS
jgi:hypothetical protein